MLTDWLMVIITAIYVVATIFICIYNGKSASAAKQQSEIAQKQMKEMVDQYNAVNRPMVTVRFDIIRSGLLCFVIENEGPLPAREVQIKVNDAFLENLSTIESDNRLADLNNVALYLASQQKLTLFIGSQVRFTDIAKVPAIFDISYNGTYNEHIEIDISQYRFMLVYKSALEDISQHLGKIEKEDKHFHKDLIKSVSKPSTVQTIIAHAATEDDGNKFRVYKAVCLNSHMNTASIAAVVNLDKDYVYNLLSELQKVDCLVAYTFHEDTTDMDKALWYRR